MSGINRFKLALERIEPSQWRRFEEFASAFLASEFPSIRSMGTASGDGGRDGELYKSDGLPHTLLQYSVTDGWKSKIRDTIKKIKANFPEARELIYVTNQEIGAKADNYRSEARKDGITLDIRDRSYFLDRFHGSEQLKEIAESLSKDIVDPYLESKEVIERKPQALTTEESRAALLFLELQWEDDTRDKGLTKTAFDALLRTALRFTSYPDKTMPRRDVYKAVEELLPEKDTEYVRRETEKALGRMERTVLKHDTSNDSFCLSYDERVRLQERMAKNDIEEGLLQKEFAEVALSVCSENIAADPKNLHFVAINGRASLEKFLLQRGEVFVQAMHSGQLKTLGTDLLKEVVASHLKSLRLPAKEYILSREVQSSVEYILKNASPNIARHLRNVADTYTLFAFLRQTPDVQSAVKKMFSFGEIWFDSSILLPLFAEELVPEEEHQFRRLVKACKDASLKLKVTPGVIEEIEGHFNRCIAYAAGEQSNWRGSIPYLYAFYVSTGASPQGFTTWISTFIGRARPQDDISDFLREDFGIQTLDISIDAKSAPDELRIAVKEQWTAIHEERRSQTNFDPHLTLKLADHDAENFLGVISRRKTNNDSALGYSSWWLTLDHQAFHVSEVIEIIIGQRLPSPVMSADFLANYLAFGPNRGQVARQSRDGLPVALDALDPSLVAYLTPDLIALATQVREGMVGQPERVIRREVRDALDKARRRPGSIQEHGLTLRRGAPTSLP